MSRLPLLEKGRTIIPEGISKAQIKKGLRNTVKLKIDGIDNVFELGVTRYLPSSGSINISSATSGQPVDLVLSGDKREIYSRVYESSRTCNVWKIVKVCQRGKVKILVFLIKEVLADLSVLGLMRQIIQFHLPQRF